MYQATSPGSLADVGNNMDWNKRKDVDQGAGVRSLRYPPAQKARCTLTEEISHEEECLLVQSLEQFEQWEPTVWATDLHDVGNCYDLWH
jgi:hypothetical protein